MTDEETMDDEYDKKNKMTDKTLDCEHDFACGYAEDNDIGATCRYCGKTREQVIYEKGKTAGLKQAQLHCPDHTNLPYLYCQMCLNEKLKLAKQAGRDEVSPPKGVYIEKALPLTKENLIRITETDEQTIKRLDEKLAALSTLNDQLTDANREHNERIAALSKEKQRLESLYSQSEIAKDALEKQIEIMRIKQCPTCNSTRSTTQERVKCYCCLEEECARLRDFKDSVMKIRGCSDYCGCPQHIKELEKKALGER